MPLARLVLFLVVALLASASPVQAAVDDSFGDFTCTFDADAGSDPILAYNQDVFNNSIAGDPLMVDDTDSGNVAMEGPAQCVFNDVAGATKSSGPAASLTLQFSGIIVNHVCGTAEWTGRAMLTDFGDTQIAFDLSFFIRSGRGQSYATGGTGQYEIVNPNVEAIHAFMGSGTVDISPTQGDCQTTNVTEHAVVGSLTGQFGGDQGRS
jgi:hypothetical protein